MRTADNLYHLHVPIALKSGSFNLLEPSGPVQACNGIALPLLHGMVVIQCVVQEIGWVDETGLIWLGRDNWRAVVGKEIDVGFS